MSASFDSLQRAIASLPDSEVKARLRFAVSALHDWDHKHEGVLNHDRGFALEAAAAEKAALATPVPSVPAAPTLRTISTGEPSTLRTYRKIAQVFGPGAVAFIDGKASETVNGLDEEVWADERQMLVLLASFVGGSAQAHEGGS